MSKLWTHIAGRWRMVLALALLALCLSGGAVHAHMSSASYLRLDVAGARIDGQWDIALRDLDVAIGLDANGDGAITWGEVRAKRQDIWTYASSRLRLSADGRDCPLTGLEQLVDSHADGGYAVLRFSAACAAAPSQLHVHYALLFDRDPLHRGLLRVALDGSVRTIALSPDAPDADFALVPGLGATVRTFFEAGVTHLLTGIDHMLFVTMLLVPAMFHRGPASRLIPRASLRNTLVETVKVLSAFTLSHATTLTLSALHILSVPTRVSESGIALTILATAADNVWPFLPGRRWMLALVFGLVHGLGFATALGPLDLPTPELAAALVSFNLGLEAAQVTLAVIILPFGFLARNTLFYPRIVMPGLSALVGVVAMAWFIDRVGDFGMMPF